MIRETWYVLEDGSHGDPRLVKPDDNGVLRHESGVAVAIGGHGNPRSIGVDVGEDDLEIGASGEKKAAAKQAQAKNIKPAKGAGAGYETR